MLRNSVRHAPSLADRMAAVGHSTSGFDYLRIGLALLIMTWHSLLVTHGLPWVAGLAMHPLELFVRAALPMFFALSGFLVAGSLERNPSIPTFVLFRVLRIVPALAVEITLSALVIGAATTSLALADYYAHPGFRTYFLNIIGWIHFTLPGVFSAQPDDTVNRSLWTIPTELECYLFLVAAALAGLYRHRQRLLIATLAVFAGYVAFRLIRNGAVPGLQPGAGIVLSRLLIFYFMAGVLLRRFHHIVPFSAPLFLLAATGAVLALRFEPTVWLSIPPLAYATAYLGLLDPPKPAPLRRGDYSYGIYLYAYPLQQCCVWLFPGARWYENLALALPAVTLFSVASWHLIEKPALGLKRLFGRAPTLERVRIERRVRAVPWHGPERRLTQPSR